MPNKDLRAEWKSSEKVSKPQYITDILIAIRKPRKVVREGTKADQYRRVASAARAASFKRRYRNVVFLRVLPISRADHGVLFHSHPERCLRTEKSGRRLRIWQVSVSNLEQTIKPPLKLLPAEQQLIVPGQLLSG